MRILFLTLALMFQAQTLHGQTTDSPGITAYKNEQYTKAQKLLHAESDAGKTKSMVFLARYYLQSDTGNTDFQKSYDLFVKASKANEPEAFYWLGLAHLKGRVAAPDFEKAKANFISAGELGYLRAYLRLAEIYINGETVPKDPKAAEYYLKIGVNKGHTSSKLRLANMYKDGEGIPKNPVGALELYKSYYADLAAKGIKDDYGIGKSIIEQAVREVMLSKHEQSGGVFKYNGTLPTCDKALEKWTDCFGIRLIKNSAKGARYEGEYKNDQPDGQGGMYWPDGQFYEGGFKEGIRYGLGSYTFADGGRLAGQWRGLLNGYGQEIDADGNIVYTGEYKAGKRYSDADRKQETIQTARDKCERRIRQKYEFTETDKYGNRKSQRFEVLNYGYNLEDHQTSYFGFGNHTVLVFPSVMFNNGSMVRGNPRGYCVIRRGTYLNGNDIIDVEVRIK